ncbi:MAG TPA: hypothetical protein VE981_13875, partial [Planctomycetota bacterium]|nr:hypothetical protein [Planctomycetota bacterium]
MQRKTLWSMSHEMAVFTPKPIPGRHPELGLQPGQMGARTVEILDEEARILARFRRYGLRGQVPSPEPGEEDRQEDPRKRGGLSGRRFGRQQHSTSTNDPISIVWTGLLVYRGFA